MATGAAAVREALLAQGFTSDGVLAELGGDGFAALGRGEPVPARHILAESGDEPLPDLIRLFLLGEPVALPNAQRALPLASAEAMGLVARVEEGAAELVRARLQVHPYPTPGGDGFVVSDFPAWAGGRMLKADHVVGVGGASVTLATITPRDPVAQTLDLGTGCGIQALLASAHSGRVVATDRSERALAMAELTGALSGAAFDARAGSLFEPVAEESFDLVVANPPFVISPHARYTYREAPMRADDLSRTVVQQAAERLRPDGTAVLLANWLHTVDEPWQQRLAGWLPPETQMWAAQRERLTPPEYVEVWLRDSAEHGGPEHAARYAEWLTYFDDLGAIGVGFGWIVLRRSDQPWLVCEDVSEADRLPTGAEVAQQMRDFAALQDASAVRLLAAAPHWRAATQLHRSWSPAQAGSGDLSATGAWRPVAELDPDVADLVTDSGSLQERIARVAGEDADRADDLTARALVGIRRLIGAGFVSLE